jgi:hypothetical protein
LPVRRALDSLEASLFVRVAAEHRGRQDTEIATANGDFGPLPMLGRLPVVGRPFRVGTDEPAAI